MTNTLSRLLKPLDLPGGRRVKNRIVMPPLVIWKAEEAAEVNDFHRRHYAQSAPGCGIAIVEATTVSPEGRLAATQLGIFEDRHVAGLSDLARTIREAGALPGIQLHHAGGRTDVKKTYGRTPLVPSKLPGMEEVQELVEADIARIIEAFGSAAARAVEAGFELLEIHGAHGYLGAQFLSPRTNRRRDRWGGDLQGRLRFLIEVVRRVRSVVGERALVSCRLGVADDTSDNSDGLTIEEGTEAAKALAAEGLDLIHTSYATTKPQPLDASAPFHPFLQLSKPVTEALSIPVIAVGGITTPREAEDALAQGYGDMIAVGRGILADPGWAAKTVAGQGTDIALCIDCKPRCFHYKEPEKCPARRKLGIGPPGA